MIYRSIRRHCNSRTVCWRRNIAFIILQCKGERKEKKKKGEREKKKNGEEKVAEEEKKNNRRK